MAIIYGSDWNPVIQKMRSVLSTPDATTDTLGYNTTYSANDVAANQVIDHTHWDALRSDINKAYTLQTGANSTLTARTSGTTILSADLTTISGKVGTAYTNRLTADTGQLSSVALGGYSNTAAWGGSLSPTGTVTWSSNDKCRGFFNAGGRIVWSFSRSGGDSTSQNQSWSNLCTNVGSIVLTRDSMFQSGQSWNGTWSNSWNTNGAYGSRPTSYQQAFYRYGTDASYTSNYIELQLYWDNAAVKTGKVLYWKVNFVDGHTALGAGPDYVNGTIAVNCTAQYPFSNAPT